MDIKMLKTKVCNNKVLLCQTVEQGIDVDFNLPDYCPAVTRILKCKLIPRINSKNVGSGSAIIDGSATITLIYADSENKICSFEYVVPIAKSIELKEDCSGARIGVKARCSYCNCRAVTQRKIDVHGAVELDIKIIKPHHTEIVCDADNSEVQLRRGSAPTTNPMGYCEKNLVIEDDIELGQGQQEISSIIRYEANPCITDCKIISGKVMLKGEIVIRLLYCPSDSNRPVISRTALPYSQIMDIEGIHEGCECDSRIDIAYLEIKPKANSAGQVRCITINAKLMFKTECYCNDDVPVILDAFCTKHKSETKTQNVNFDKIISSFNENYVCKKNLEFSDDAIGSVLDMWCDAGASSVRTEGATAIIGGTVLACMLIYDAQGNATYQERPVEYEFRHTLPFAPEEFYCDPQIEVVNCSFTILGENTIEVLVEINICAAVYEKKKMPLIVDITLGDEENDKCNSSGLVVYYACEGEEVWNIARKYNSAVEEIMQINSLEGDVLDSAKPLIICL